MHKQKASEIVNISIGSKPVDGNIIPNILALWREKQPIEKNPEFETRKYEKLYGIFQWIFQPIKQVN